MAKKKKTNKKKVIMTVSIVVVVFLVVQLTAMGWIGGLGPLGFLAQVRMSRIPGNAEEYHLDHVQPLANSPLQGKTICFLGSSVTYGDASLGVSMADYIAKLDGCTIIKEAVSGTTLAGSGSSTYPSRLLENVDPNASIDILVCQLSTNDASQKKALGSVLDSTDLEAFDRETVVGAMEYIIAYAKATWGCDVVFYTGTRYDSPEYQAMVDVLPALKEKWDIGVIDLWNDPEMNAVSQANYDLYMNDNIHPTQAGYLKWWVPKFQQALYERVAS